jgi:hypothetical protein
LHRWLIPLVDAGRRRTARRGRKESQAEPEEGPGGKRDAAEANVYGEGNHETKPPLITLLSVASQRSTDGTKGGPHL